MELLLITQNRLKIVLTKEDMTKYGIAAEGENDCPHMRSILARILKEEEKGKDFDPMKGDLRIRMYTCRGGGCELYSYADQSAKLPVPTKRSEKRKQTVFSFGELDDLLAACCHLRGNRDILQSSAFWQGEKQMYYLVLTTPEQDVFGRDPCLFCGANEYGVPIRRSWMAEYLAEHAQCFCEGEAVKTLGMLGK